MTMDQDYPYLGFGLGLRTDHYQTILNGQPAVDWFEIISENYMVKGGKPLHFLDQIAERYPMVMHGVSLSIGSTDPIDLEYLTRLKQLAQRINAKWISDHLCWTGVMQKNTHDLLPMPYTQAALDHIVSRMHAVQEFLGRPILLENPSTYLTFKESEYTEWDFIVELVKQTGCYLLLDINNIYVSAFNHDFDPVEYLNHIPVGSVKQFHLAGHCNMGTHIIDTHDSDVIDPVWALYAKSIKRFGAVSTMIERDDQIPPLASLCQELDHARKIFKQAYESVAA